MFSGQQYLRFYHLFHLIRQFFEEIITSQFFNLIDRQCCTFHCLANIIIPVVETYAFFLAVCQIFDIFELAIWYFNCVIRSYGRVLSAIIDRTTNNVD